MSALPNFNHIILSKVDNLTAKQNKQSTESTIAHHPSQVDTPLSITNHQTKRTYYYHRDHQGSIIALSNEAGEIVESFIYDGHYGKILNHYTTEDTMNPYGYTGRETDLPDLYYYRARYYDPTTQRFLTLDPIGYRAGDFNWYRYVGNDPVNFRDPSGLGALKIAKEIKDRVQQASSGKKKLSSLKQCYNEAEKLCDPWDQSQKNCNLRIVQKQTECQAKWVKRKINDFFDTLDPTNMAGRPYSEENIKNTSIEIPRFGTEDINSTYIRRIPREHNQTRIPSICDDWYNKAKGDEGAAEILKWEDDFIKANETMPCSIQ